MQICIQQLKGINHIPQNIFGYQISSLQLFLTQIKEEISIFHSSEMSAINNDDGKPVKPALIGACFEWRGSESDSWDPRPSNYEAMLHAFLTNRSNSARTVQLVLSRCTLLNRLYGEWKRDCLPVTFVFKKTCNRNKFVWVSRWISGFYIIKSCKECHWTPFYPPNTLRGREYHFQVVRMFLREISHKQCAETSVHRETQHAVTRMTIVNFLVNVLQHTFNKQFKKHHFPDESNSNWKLILFTWDIDN